VAKHFENAEDFAAWVRDHSKTNDMTVGRPRPVTEGCRLRSLSLTSVNHGPDCLVRLEQYQERGLAGVSGRLGSRAAPATQSR